ncbi:calpain-C [Drosophila guanche]|uniref:Blast:Calpain-C n=1 Tax=Drosophila guanche TaxID=7266 RepID=A0A3B0KUK8_DROGU|nr:calpain-C [Drosophila obscura]XP_034140018.1 calpain-C [Drosophila guanche]SPP89516.1 blast:Calpain-C [Drosophila guanche]
MASKYERIISDCRTKNVLWEDGDFPAVQSSVFYYQTPPFTFQWKRIAELNNAQASFLNENAEFDVVPGKMGDRWLVSCLGVLYSLRNLFYRVVPADQSLNKSQGIYRFRLWWCGEWVEVLVDDRLPTINGRLAFMQPQSSNCFWAALLEKAIAKLHGSYEALKYGTRSDGLTDLLGGVVKCMPIVADTIRPQTLKDQLASTCIVTCLAVKASSVQKKNIAERLPNGILVNVNYRLSSLDKVETLMGDSVQLICVKDTFSCKPFGDKTNFLGDWSPLSKTWERVSSGERARLLNQLNLGEFWMSFYDFVQIFTALEIVYLDSETANDEEMLKNRPLHWKMKMYQGQWKRGVTAGGCRNHESFHINPQLLVSVQEKQDVVIALNQHTAVEPKVIGFTMYTWNREYNLNECLQKDFFKNHVSFLNSDYGNTRHVSYHTQLEAGHYVLIPTTYEPAEEAHFTIRILGTSALRLSCLETQTMILLDPFPALKSEDSIQKIKSVCQYEPVYMQLADENKTINCFELHELLEACLPNDYIKGCANIDICRQVIALQDKSGNGRITFQQFKTFMVNLKSWQGVFKMYTKEKAGILRAERLRDALCDIGFQLSTDIMNCLIQRYIRKDGTLRLSDFVSAVIHLTTAFNQFHLKNYSQVNVIEVHLHDWIKSILSC